ncbi:MAG: squalene synthase HpnC [Candidatus Acidiferrales bacterium]
MQATPELEIARTLPAAGCSGEEARRYTAWLATHHYENFNVVSWLLPRRLHQNFYNVYAYCRWADDLGDEVSDSSRALAYLDGWEEELRACYAGSATHPVFLALAGTIRDCEIPIEPFSNLLQAFRRDQRVHRYPDWEAVKDYCEYSANPVGRLVLHVCGYHDAERQQLSDFTCTALQLANFWQDVARDLEKGRIYIPLEVAAKHGVSEGQIIEKRFDTNFCALVQELIAETRRLFDLGAPLAKMVTPELRVDIQLFNRGGVAVLDAIEAIGCDSLTHRPAITRGGQMKLLSRALASRLFAPFRSGDSSGQSANSFSARPHA